MIVITLSEMVGQSFNSWRVIGVSKSKKHHLVCECVCGVVKDVYKSSLIRDVSKSCGCIRLSKARHPFDPSIKKYGHWTVIGPSEYQSKTLCRCVCGVEKDVSNYMLSKGDSLSCGCKHDRSVDYTGERFGRLVAVKPIGKSPGKRGIIWEMKCDCGNTIERAPSVVKGSRSKSCGCLVHENSGKTHGMSYHPLYRVWHSMMERCYKESHPHYDRYGGRGIGVCDEWREDFMVFIKDMEDTYEPRLQLERIDNDKGYSKDNCTWATRKEQARNRKSTRYVVCGGVKMSLPEACERIGISYATGSSLYMRGKFNDKYAGYSFGNEVDSDVDLI